MSRIRQFTINTCVGYVLIGVNIFYTILSIPLALGYLSTEEFGLWALATQITSYLMLLDLGVTSAISRFLADSKDDPEAPAYTAVFKAGCMVFALQGLIVAAVGVLFSFYAPSLFSVPQSLQSDFRNILIILSLTSGLTLALRATGAPLWAHQRLDVHYVLSIATLLSGLLFLWVGFAAGCGIYSLALASVPALLVCPFISFLVCRQNGYYPRNWEKGGIDRALFRRIFLFGKDVLLMSLGWQLVNFSQIIILSRVAGLEAAATFAVGTKIFTMSQQISGRMVENSVPALIEIYVRKNKDLFRKRFQEILALSIFLAVVSALVLICGNSAIVSFWTSGKLVWASKDDLLLGLLLVITAGTRCTVGVFGMVANMRPVRSVYFLEACVFVALAIPASSLFGITGILVTSLIAHAAVTVILPIRAAVLYVGDDTGFMRLLLIASGIIVVVFFAGPVWISVIPPKATGVMALAGLVAIGATAAWLLVLSPGLRTQLYRKFLSLPFFTRE